MFTGIIETTAHVLEKRENQLLLERPKAFSRISLGQSIAVNGACLSVIDFSKKDLSFDVVPETFQRTNLGEAKVVNLERALKVDGRFEGHIVLGHVDGIIQLQERIAEGTGERLYFSLSETIIPYVVEKGSISLNGISLTIAGVSKDSFSIACIPHTLEKTNFGTVAVGDYVNVEVDIMAKYWHHWKQK